MYKNVLNKIISVGIVIILLFPIGLQLFHTLENHEHKICDAKNVQHLHEQKIDCSIYHFQLNTTALISDFKINIYSPLKHISSPFSIKEEIIEFTLFYKSSRAPPFFIV